MDEKSQEDWLDRQLREAAPYIDDEGFTAQVLKRLPSRRRARRPLRAVILLGITSLGASSLTLLRMVAVLSASNVERLAMLPMLWLFALALGCGILVTALGLMAPYLRQAICSLRYRCLHFRSCA